MDGKYTYRLQRQVPGSRALGAQGPGTSPYRALSLRPPRLFRRFPLSPLERGEGAPLKYRPASDRR
jgi:hypothetical protein